MILILLAYVGGVLTILSPCILPVLPFVFARADQPFLRSGLPMLLGMALTFAVVATLAAVAGGWAVAANQYGRAAAIVLLAAFGLTLLFPHLADRAMQPLVRLGGRLSDTSGGTGHRGPVLSSFLLGIATGLLWAPCAGPVLGLILTGAALGGASFGTSLLLLAYAAGAATSLGLALLVGGRVYAVMKRSLGAGEWVRRGLGMAVLAGVAAIALGLDAGVLTRVSLAGTASLEQTLLDRLRPAGEAPSADGVAVQPAGLQGQASSGTSGLPVERSAPALAGATEWLNSAPLTTEALKGKVVLVDFWTYSCINCLRAIPYVQAWAEKYKDQGLVVIGVHAPEFAFEKQPDNVRKAVADLKITYPVAIDNDYAIWRAFDNQYWPAHYFIDAEGRVRHHHFGEGEYERSEAVIQALLKEAGHADVAADVVAVKATGAQAAGDAADVKSPETYLGYERGENFASSEEVTEDKPAEYSASGDLDLNAWALTGNWTIEKERAVLNQQGGHITYRFHARDLHLVLGPGPDGKPVRFRVSVDGQPPGDSHGTDTAPDGSGTVAEQRLYQLIRQPGPVADHTFEITFTDPGAQAFAFTFG